MTTFALWAWGLVEVLWSNRPLGEPDLFSAFDGEAS